MSYLPAIDMFELAPAAAENVPLMELANTRRGHAQFEEDLDLCSDCDWRQQLGQVSPWRTPNRTLHCARNGRMFV